MKIRTFRGAVGRVLDGQRGAPAYLTAIRRAAGEFSAAAAALSAGGDGPGGLAHAPGRRAGGRNPPLVGRLAEQLVAASPRLLSPAGSRRDLAGPGSLAITRGSRAEPLAAFHQQQREAIVLAVEKLSDELDRLSRVGNETLRPRLLRLLGGHARAALLERVQAAHRLLPAVDDDYRAFLRAELDAWKEGNPRAVRFLQTLDHAAAVARPAITISLAVSGWVLAGDLVGQAAVHTAGQLATEAAIAGGITGGGEALVSTTSEGVRQAAARLFRRLQSRYAQQRARWLADWLERELFGDLLDELHRGAEVPQTAAFVEAEAAVAALSQSVAI